jgi:hypothetical protein
MRYTQLETDYIIKNYPNVSTIDIANHLSRCLHSVYRKANKLGLKKTDEYLKTEQSGRIAKGMSIRKSTTFKKGNIPFNKGQKLNQSTYEKIKHTMFKKGHTPANHKPIGYERISLDGYVEVKVKEPNVFKFKHRLLWEKINGKIPKCFVVVFKDKDKSNIKIENLELISQSENMKRNSIYNYPPEVVELIKLKNKLSRTIKKIKR